MDVLLVITHQTLHAMIIIIFRIFGRIYVVGMYIDDLGVVVPFVEFLGNDHASMCSRASVVCLQVSLQGGGKYQVEQGKFKVVLTLPSCDVVLCLTPLHNHLRMVLNIARLRSTSMVLTTRSLQVEEALMLGPGSELFKFIAEKVGWRYDV